jgi:hypothetical protein
LYLGLCSILDLLTGGGGGDTPDPVDVFAINMQLNENTNSINSCSSSINNLNATSTKIFTNLNSLSTNSILSINNLNATSTTILNNLNSL